MYKKIVAFLCFFSHLHGENVKLEDSQIIENINTYRIRLNRLSQTIKNMSEAQKQVISPKLIEFDALLQEAEHIKRDKKNDLVSARLNELDAKLKSRIRFISKYCKDCQAGKMTSSPGERNVFEERSESKRQKLEDSQIQYVPTVETPQRAPSDSIVNEESGRP